MKTVAEETKNRKNSARKRLAAALVFFALLLTIFPVSIFSDVKLLPKGMVFCPLSKKFQLVDPLEKKKEKKPFDAICASSKTKELLFQEIFIKTPWRAFTLDAKSFENLVFNYLAHGKSALDKLPLIPNAPSKNSVEKVAANIISNNRGEYKFIWKYSAAIAALSPNLKPRPPTNPKKSSFSIQPIYRSTRLSRRLSPRAPPLS